MKIAVAVPIPADGCFEKGVDGDVVTFHAGLVPDVGGVMGEELRSVIRPAIFFAEVVRELREYRTTLTSLRGQYGGIAAQLQGGKFIPEIREIARRVWYMQICNWNPAVERFDNEGPFNEKRETFLSDARLHDFAVRAKTAAVAGFRRLSVAANMCVQGFPSPNGIVAQIDPVFYYASVERYERLKATPLSLLTGVDAAGRWFEAESAAADSLIAIATERHREATRAVTAAGEKLSAKLAETRQQISQLGEDIVGLRADTDRIVRRQAEIDEIGRVAADAVGKARAEMAARQQDSQTLRAAIADASIARSAALEELQGVQDRIGRVLQACGSDPRASCTIDGVTDLGGRILDPLLRASGELIQRSNGLSERIFGLRTDVDQINALLAALAARIKEGNAVIANVASGELAAEKQKLSVDLAAVQSKLLQGEGTLGRLTMDENNDAKEFKGVETYLAATRL